MKVNKWNRVSRLRLSKEKKVRRDRILPKYSQRQKNNPTSSPSSSSDVDQSSSSRRRPHDSDASPSENERRSSDDEEGDDELSGSELFDVGAAISETLLE